MFFRFALVLRAFSKWGVPQTPESNTKVLLSVARCAKLWFWIRAESLVLCVTKPGCTYSSATWFCYAKVATQFSTQSGKQLRKSITIVFPLCGCGFALVLDKIKSLDKHNKSRMHEKQRNRLLLCCCASRWLTQSGKQQQKNVAIVFRFAVARIFCFRWGSRPKPWAVLCAVYLASGCAYRSGKCARPAKPCHST
jgi:hypothetical protein